MQCKLMPNEFSWNACKIFEKIPRVHFYGLTLSWRRPLSYRKQFIDLQSKSMDWFLYDNGLRHEKVNCWLLPQTLPKNEFHHQRISKIVLPFKLFSIFVVPATNLFWQNGQSWLIMPLVVLTGPKMVLYGIIIGFILHLWNSILAHILS